MVKPGRMQQVVHGHGATSYSMVEKSQLQRAMAEWHKGQTHIIFYPKLCYNKMHHRTPVWNGNIVQQTTTRPTSHTLVSHGALLVKGTVVKHYTHHNEVELHCNWYVIAHPHVA